MDFQTNIQMDFEWHAEQFLHGLLERGIHKPQLMNAGLT